MPPNSEFQAPPRLQQHDLIRIVAPAGPFNRTWFWRGMGWLGEHFRLTWSSHIFQRDGFLAGSDEERRADFHAALQCPHARAIVCARGGVGSAELVADLTPAQLRRSPKWLVGFSDITALHCAYQRSGLMSVHASNVTSLGPACETLRQAWLRHVTNPLRSDRLALETLFPGSARGPLVGGNLAVLHDLCASDEWQPPARAVLFLEEIAEPPYRIHRMLTALARRGLVQRLSAIVVGQITDSNPGPHGTTAREVFERFSAAHRLPCGWGLPAGHELARNLPLTLGAPVEVSLTHASGSLELNAR